MKTIKSTIGLAAVCITAVAMADGANVVSFEKPLAAKDTAGVSAGMCATPTEMDGLVDAQYVQLCDAKMGKCIYAANTRIQGGSALAADASATLLKGEPDGGKITSNKIEMSESLKMPSFNENDIVMPKSLDSRVASVSGNRIAGNDLQLIANVSEMAVDKPLGECAK